MYFVYLLKCNDGSLYCGITTDVVRRLDEHKRGKGAKYTRAKRAGTIMYLERKRNRSSASKREAAIKKLSRSQKITLVRSQVL